MAILVCNRIIGLAVYYIVEGSDLRKSFRYCIEKGYNAAGDTVAQCAANWGFELDEAATAQDFWDAIVAAYDTVEEAEETENAGMNRLQLTIAALGSEGEEAGMFELSAEENRDFAFYLESLARRVYNE